MQTRVGKTNSHKNFFFKCESCDYSYETTLPAFISNELPKLLDVKALNLKRSFENGNIKFYSNHGIKALMFRKMGWKN